MLFQRKKVASALAYALGAGGAVLGSAAAIAQDVRVEVTGTSIRRVDAETSLPVTVVTREEIALTGATNVEQLIATLPMLNTLGGTQLSTGAGLGTYGASSASLRGLGEERTLVLVNGRRMAGFPNDGAVNINAIPIAAIQRVEVLRDGASAVYGSDAVAGVINFILFKDYQGVEVGGQYGQPTQSGGGEGWNAYIIGGWGNLSQDKFNVTGSLSYTKEKALYGADRDYAAVGTVLPYFISGATGQGNIEGGYNAGQGLSPSAGRQPGFGLSPGSGYGNPLAASNQCELINMRLNPTPTSKGAPFCNYDTAPFVGLIPDSERWNANVNFTWQITPDVQFFAEGLYAKQEVVQTYQGSPITSNFLSTADLIGASGGDYALLIRPSNPNYQVAADYLRAQGRPGFETIIGQPLAITSRVQDFGGRQSTDEVEQWRVLAGLRGTFAKQDWEVAYYHNESKLDGQVTGGYFSMSEFSRIINSRDDWNPWTLQQTPEFQQAIAAANYLGPTLAAKQKLDTVDGKISGEIIPLPAGPLLYALGASWSEQSVVLNPAPAQFTGDIAGLGGATVNMDESRRVTAIYGEVNVPILRGSAGGDLEASAAIRYDDYSDFGGTTNYFASLRWQPIQQVVGRVAYGTGFRAPTLSDLHYPILLGSSAQLNDPVTGQTDIQPLEYTGGNPDLQPETSKQWSLGLIFQPVKQFSIGFDWFSIELEDIIATPSAQEAVSGAAAGNPSYANSVVRDPVTGNIISISSQTTNVGTADVKGVDVTINYRDTFDWGTPSISLLGTYMDKFDQTSPGGFTSKKVGTIIDECGFPVLDSDGGGVIPRWKHQLRFGYEYGPYAAFLTQNFYKGYQTDCDLNGDPHFTGSQSIWDLQFVWTGVKNLRLAIGANNLFDKDPPIFIPVSNQFQSGYDASMYDPRGRFVYLQASYRFQ